MFTIAVNLVIKMSFVIHNARRNISYIILFLIFVPSLCVGNFNIFLSDWEVRRLLGVSAELYYVRDGVINTHAMNFPVPVSSHISSLYFTWEALYGQHLSYTMNLSVSNKEAIPEPSLNVSLSGTIPTESQTFELTVVCSNKINTEVEVFLNINVSFHKFSGNYTPLTFKRKKSCIKDTVLSVQKGLDMHEPEEMDGYTYIATACACILLTMLAAAALSLMHYVRVRKSISVQTVREPRTYSSNPVRAHITLLTRTGNTEQFILDTPKDCTPNYETRTNCILFKRLPSYNPFTIDANPENDIHEFVSDILIPRRCVKLNELVLEGTFGRIYKGVLLKDDENAEEEVVIKTVADHASDIQRELLVKEGIKFRDLNHINILSVLGVALENLLPPYVIYPHYDSTNLKQFLCKCKLCPEGIAHSLTTQEVVDMALQVICGIQFLHEECVIHGDIAARNCVVDAQLKVRVADSALARDLFSGDYHCLGDNINRPVKWLALESLVHNMYTVESDVWSFGVFLWELTTLAQQPYTEIDPFEMAAYLGDGYRLAQPVNCPDELFAVMAYCWTAKPEDRPTFNQLRTCLQEFSAQLIKYV